MAPKQGRLSSLAVSTDGGSTYTALGSLVDATLNHEKTEIDVSDRDSGEWAEFLPGRKSATIDATANWDKADAQLITLLNAFYDDSKLDFRYRLDTIAGEEEFTAEGYVTGFPLPAPGEDKATVDITIRLTGAVTKATQT